ncbi:site-specific integrase [soil metagenome]
MAQGSVFRSGSGWGYVIDVGGSGDRKQRRRKGYRTKRAALAALAEMQTSLQRGDYVEPIRMTLAEFLVDEWLPAVASTVRASTLASYRLHVERYIVPRVGGRRLQEITGAVLNGLYAELLAGGLAPGTVRKTHTVLRRALRDAVRWGRTRLNAAVNADPPKQPGAGSWTVTTWTAAELSAFLEQRSEDRLYALWHVLASTGMRRGEVAGLRWTDVDLDVARLSIRQARLSIRYEIEVEEPKSARSRRSIALDVETVQVLRAWRAAQLRERLEWGPAWTDSGLVFTREDGVGLHPDRISKLFDSLVARSGLPRIRLHDLRHTHATLALQVGVHPKVVSERLGHSSISLTLDTYSHAVPALQAEAAESVANLLQQARAFSEREHS